MRIAIERGLLLIALLVATGSASLSIFSLVPDHAVLDMLFFAVLLVVFIFLFLKLEAPFYSPLFLFPYVYVFIFLVGLFAFEIIYGRAPASEVAIHVVTGFLGLSIGILVGQYGCAPMIKRRFQSLKSSPNVKLLYGLAFVGFMAFFMMIGIKGVPILAHDIDQAKVGFYSGLGHLNVVYGLVPITAIAILADGIIRGDKRRVQIAHIIFLLSLLTMAVIGFRSLLIKNLISYVVFLGLFQRLKLSNYTVGFYGILLIAVASWFGAYRRGNEGFHGVLNELGITIGARTKAAELISINLDGARSIDFSYFGDFQKLLPGKQIGQNVDLKNSIYHNADAMPELAGINPSIVGEALLAGGPSMVLFAPLIIGLSVAVLYSFAIKRLSNLFWPILYAVVVSDLLGALASGIATRLPGLAIKFCSVLIVVFIYRLRFTFSGRGAGNYACNITIESHSMERRKQ
ncbi:hypothetical protein DWB85_13970 [Seongchinamella sediminis]|uniref:Oligosaccharide repeat unit polymerase n=1 Tax=Seongchinamella sediminis TaxID=2283635 RepID=A0A3L7DYI1_9GAMM|nr:hypothetical protein [Seongchinamella sediminis]RLQ21183.1 hypothetical protein DWB85_13970 [Seongchinamella sediminis]